ncbi:unnamed protein product [Effrenium voratum]|nr:unnamed protein product [Effrenium voratum]
MKLLVCREAKRGCLATRSANRIRRLCGFQFLCSTSFHTGHFKFELRKMQESHCLRLAFFDGEVEVTSRNTFLDVEVTPLAQAKAVPRCRSSPALLRFEEQEMFDAKLGPWARMVTDQTVSTDCPDSVVDLEFERQTTAETAANGEKDPDDGVEWQAVRTVMIKNIPCRCSSQEVLRAVNTLGFDGTYDFFYLPMNRRHKQGIGYAFINFREPGAAAKFKQAIWGYRFPGRNSTKVVHVAVAQLQGREEVDAYFSNTQVVHTRYRPVVA